ncbi:MAG TPA: c-type cytochrome [Vicinamibacterales bacterium]|jgi:cytochrome c5
MEEHDPHSSPIKSPKQLIIVVLLAFVIPIVVITLVTQLVTGSRFGARDSDRDVLPRIQAVGHVVIGEAAPPKGTLAGEAVYGQVCKSCHEAGLAGAPKIGDKSAWGPRIAQGQSTAVQHAVAGFQGKTGVMPPKGGNADLTDTEVARAVVFMANQSGANWKEPSAPPTAAGAATAAAPSTPAPAAASAAPTNAHAAQADGKKIYESTCIACHGAGIAGAPKFGDKGAWSARIAEGNNTLYMHAIQGFQGKSGVMPPKGGNTTLSDADVKAAVDYMVSAAK